MRFKHPHMGWTNMDKYQGNPFKLLSVLLQYPDEEYLIRIKKMEGFLTGMVQNELKNSCLNFLNYLKTRAPIRLQESYTAVFDMNPETTLNLTYHMFGDNEKRAGMLTRLQQIYLDAGYECTTGELPDYLPLMLEFLSACPEANGIALIWECFKNLNQYVDRLQQTAPAYSALLQPLVHMAANRFQTKAGHLQQV
jgi:nitrate reductase delta subunit